MVLVTPLTACSSDALYAFCDDEIQCGTRSQHRPNNRQRTVDLFCIEASVDLGSAGVTRGSFCTSLCEEDADCRTERGRSDGACIQWEGDDEAFCYQRCDTGHPCYFPSSTCQSVLREGVPLEVCLPSRV